MSDGKMPSEEALREIRKRASAATPGPWLVYENQVNKFITDRGITSEWENPDLKWPMPVVALTIAKDVSAVWMTEADASFIAAARQDVPELLNMVDFFGHKLIYAALMDYSKRKLFKPEETAVLERAMELCWRILKSRELGEDGT